jgi:signal transduction histidine kinase/CheY-like chemotaxis protein
MSTAAVALTRLTWPMFRSAPFAPVFGAVALSAHLGSGGAGILATAIAAAGLPILFSSAMPFGWTSPSLLIFIAIALIGSRLISGRNRAITALRKSEAELRDTLEQVRASEVKLRHAQKMEAVGQLAAGIAHNFNNLLQVTLGYTDVLMDSRRDGQIDETAIAEIRRATERGASLTRQLLAFGRKHDARVGRVDIDATLAALRDMLTRVVREDIDLTFALESGGACIEIDPYDLEQMVFNLVINARDALPAGGSVHVEASQITQDGGMAPGTYVRLLVRDNGSGMTPEVQAHLFEPFFTTKEVGQGTGLGLAFVDGIVRHAGGFVTVDSAPGQGTTVSVFFPIAPPVTAPPPAAPAAERARAASRPARILLVEDENGVRATTGQILVRAGYDVAAAATPDEAWGIFQRRPGAVDLLLTDIVLPGMHGPELAERLLAKRPELPVVFVSGYSEVMPATAAATARMAFVPKPFAAETLVSTVERLLALVASEG